MLAESGAYFHPLSLSHQPSPLIQPPVPPHSRPIGPAIYNTLFPSCSSLADTSYTILYRSLFLSAILLAPTNLLLRPIECLQLNNLLRSVAPLDTYTPSVSRSAPAHNLHRTRPLVGLGMRGGCPCNNEGPFSSMQRPGLGGQTCRASDITPPPLLLPGPNGGHCAGYYPLAFQVLVFLPLSS